MLKYEKDIVVTNDGGIYATTIDLGNHRLTGDEPVKEGGRDLGPAAHQFLLAALGQCMVVTLCMYARRKAWTLDKISVHLNLERKHDTGEETNIIYKKILIEGNLTDEQKARLTEIAGRCPVHKLLTGKIEIVS